MTDSPGQAGHIALGQAGEERAARYLQQQGFAILDRNWRPAKRWHQLELDIVAKHRQTLVFTEVKTRRLRLLEANEPPAGLNGFTLAKRRNLVRAASVYLTQHALWDVPCRYDLICVTFLPDASASIKHYCNVIELGYTLDSGNTAWQPW